MLGVAILVNVAGICVGAVAVSVIGDMVVL